MQIRNYRFTFDAPRVWHPGGRGVTIFLNNLSVFFPAGERFFVRSVKKHARFVTDPVLQAEVKEFCAQEAIHGREHVRYNEWLASLGYPVVEMERRVERILNVVKRVVPPRLQLAATAALEHFTALMGQQILSDGRLLAGAHEELVRLWRWHALEENEHRHVAYDVFLAAGGTRFERSLVMAVATVIFWLKVIEQQLRMMAADGILLDGGEWAKFLRFMFVDPGAMRELWSLYLPYYAEGFHP